MQSTRPVFFISSGRSGSQMLHKLFADSPLMEIHHEYLCTHVQSLAVRWAMGLVTRDAARSELSALYTPALLYSDKPLWADTSNKLAWVIELLDELYPEARYVYTVRDGRKVASSFFYKLGAECYDDRSVAILAAHLADPQRLLPPPPEKKYWWLIPQAPSPWAEPFRRYDQFERICFHWSEVNRRILAQLARIPEERQYFCRLEDLVEAPRHIEGMCAFLDLPYQSGYFGRLQRPHNINRPEDRLLTAAQTAQLMRIGGDVMDHFGYSQREEYRMNYGQEEVSRG